MAATVLALSGLTVAPATAATQHCDSTTFPNKVETGGDRIRVYTGLEPGTVVCIKVGTQARVVTVDSGGYVRNSTVRNKNGKLMAISYYAYGEEEPPCEDPCS